MIPPISCLIIDDEPLAQELLSDHVERIPSLHVIGKAQNSKQALSLCKELQPDMLLLDIRMPGLSGFEFLDLLPQPVPLVVVTTAYREYALKGYEHNVVDFLEKPIFFDRFQKAIQRVEERLGSTRLNSNSKSSQEDSSINLTMKLLSVRVGRDTINILLDSINYVESLDNYVKIHLNSRSSKPVLSKMTVAQLESKLPDDSFIRINRKYIVRIDQCQKITASSILLFSGEELPIGVTFRDAVRQTLL
ncbi:LytR/AlgR family response regulator transcription factor [Spirosoma luteum]|uniref:LytR/AlgR family response regulator transcription factor n=1 Tax=Spirosoma luteum TaxID=431553 RepID=UPI0003AA57BD|nr:response regulator transcription factor [Spirosoma luteum]